MLARLTCLSSARPTAAGCAGLAATPTNMLSLGALKFRNVLASHGGPVAKIETGELPVRGRKMVLANASLIPGLTRKSALSLYSAADGTGTHPVAAVARHKAVSE